MALSLDIKVPNTLERMALKTAHALEHVSYEEKKINILRDKGVHLTDKIAKHYLMLRDAATSAFKAIKALTIDALNQGSELEKNIASMKFEVDLFSSGTNAGDQFKEIKKFADQTKIPIKELTEQWLKFRHASTPINVIGNKQSADLLKVWADIRAISQSSEVASKVTDEWISKFADGPDVAARWLQQVKAAHREWNDIGSGKAALEVKGPIAAEDKIDAAKTKMLGALKPLVDLMNEVKSTFADFVAKIASSKGFHTFISKMREDIQWVINKIPDMIAGFETFGKFLNTLGATIVDTGFEWFDKLSEVADRIGSFIDKMGKAFQFQTTPNQTSAPATTVPATPNLPPKQGSTTTDNGRQLAGITIQNLNVNGNGQSAEQIARSVRQEMQLLLQSGALSRGLA